MRHWPHAEVRSRAGYATLCPGLRSTGPCFSVPPRPTTDSARARFWRHSFPKAPMATATADQAAPQEGPLIRGANLDGIAVQVSLTVWVIRPFSEPVGAYPGSFERLWRSRPPPGE